MMRRTILAALVALPCAAAAQDYPTRAVTMIVGYPPGGNTDLMARALQPELSRALGQTVVVQNRGGAAGTLGAAEAARARPDGYTLLFSPNNPLTAQPHRAPPPAETHTPDPSPTRRSLHPSDLRQAA